jgi:hypothetical protein
MVFVPSLGNRCWSPPSCKIQISVIYYQDGIQDRRDALRVTEFGKATDFSKGTGKGCLLLLNGPLKG